MGFNSPSLNPENCRLNGDRKSHYVRKIKHVQIVRPFGSEWIFCTKCNFLQVLDLHIFLQKQPGHWGRGCLHFHLLLFPYFVCQHIILTRQIYELYSKLVPLHPQNPTFSHHFSVFQLQQTEQIHQFMNNSCSIHGNSCLKYFGPASHPPLRYSAPAVRGIEGVRRTEGVSSSSDFLPDFLRQQ